jgi:fatty acid-binding protein DegV
MAAPEIAKHVDPAGMKRAIYFVLSDLSTLARTGRLPQSVVSLGKTPNISIALRMNDEGLIVAGAQSFSGEKTREQMIDAVLRAVDHSPKTRVTFGHVQNEAAAKELQSAFHAKLGHAPEKEYVHESSPTIAVHQGPGSMSVCAIVPR